MTWTDHLIIQCLDIIKLAMIPLVIWLFKKPIKRWWRNGAT